MEITGIIKTINDTQFVSASFKKRELIVSTEEQYPQHILIEFTQDKCDLLNNFLPRQNVKVSINLRGREWINPQGEAKYFNSIQGWRIELTANNDYQTPPAPISAVDKYFEGKAQNAVPNLQPNEAFNQEEDDLPF